jgi:hypothetical protein
MCSKAHHPHKLHRLNKVVVTLLLLLLLLMLLHFTLLLKNCSMHHPSFASTKFCKHSNVLCYSSQVQQLLFWGSFFTQAS